MNNCKISVIIPVYNASCYIRRCIESVLSQSYKDFELILVDDGSTDDSGVKCDKYASQDNRIQVIHQKNSGAGAARNAGLTKAMGDYIVFIDSDDMILQGYFEALSRHDEDVVFINVDNINEEGKLVKREYMSDFKRLSLDKILRSQMTGKIPWGGVRKCVKSQIVKKHNIGYSHHRVGEEAIYSYQVLRNANTVGFIDQVCYCYMLRDDSQSHSKEEDPWGEVALSLKKEIDRQGDYIIYADTLNAFISTAAAVSIYKIAQYNSYLSFTNKARKRLRKLQSDFDYNYKIDWKHTNNKARVVLWLAKMHCWPLIWLTSKLR